MTVTRFTDQFRLGLDQASIDFVDIPLDTDFRVFIDPYAIAVTKTPWCRECHALASDFFQTVLNRLRGGKKLAAIALVANMHEDNRTRLGYSQDLPQGTGMGEQKAIPFLRAIESSIAFRSGKIEDIEDTALFVDGIGLDIISDMLTNILREPLAEYTHEQCVLHGVPLTKTEELPVWRPGKGWGKVTADLPAVDGESILLVPRSIVRKDLSLHPNQYLQDFIDKYYEKGSASATHALEKMLQRVPTKKDGSAHRGKIRDGLKGKGSIKHAMAIITGDCPEALDGYKQRARDNRPVLTPYELEDLQHNRKAIDINAVVAEMRSAAANADEVSAILQSLSQGILSALHPALQHPRKIESGTNGFGGIMFANTGELKFFGQAHARGENVAMLTSPKVINAVSLEHLKKISPSEGAIGLTMLLGPSVSDDLLERRASLAKKGTVVATYDEITEIVSHDLEPELTADLIEQLVAA